MSSKNNQPSEGTMAISMIVGGAVIIAMLLFAVLFVAAVAWSIVLLFAWNQPRRIGKLTITPREAHYFVFGGVIGAVTLPFIVECFGLISGYGVASNTLVYIYMAGYLFGAVAGGVIEEQLFEPVADEEQTGTALTILPPEREEAPVAPPSPFRFATWDDEEARK